MDPIAAAAWPPESLAEALLELGRRAGLAPAAAEMPSPPAAGPADGAAWTAWMIWAGQHMGVDVEPVETPLGDLDYVLQAFGPALVRTELDGRPVVFAVVGRRGSGLCLIAPDLREVRVPVARLRALIAGRLEQTAADHVDRVIERAGIPAERRGIVRSAMLRERLGSVPVAGLWTLRLPPEASLHRHLADAHAYRRLTLTVALLASVFGLEILGWMLIGTAVLEGQLNLGWLAAWTLLMITMVPARAVGEWIGGALSIDLATALKGRLLSGALRFDVDAVRREGAGQLLGRVIEGQAFEAVAIGGGLATLTGIIEIGLAFWILAKGAGGGLQVALLAGWLVVAGVLALRSWNRQAEWTADRLALTGDLVERMVGHRTALAQEQAGRRDRHDDHAANHYLAMSSRMDAAGGRLLALIPGGWLLVGLAGLVPAFVSGAAAPAALGVALGGVLFAQRALATMTGGFDALARAAIAWKAVGPLFRAGARAPDPGRILPEAALRAAPSPPGTRLLDLDGVVYTHPTRRDPILDGASLGIDHGERILLEGGSGSGKSTLASVIAGLRKPHAGLVTIDGLDQATLGDGWRRLATEAPQFHENHILTGSLAFNLLMGRAWPAQPADLAAAEALCRELGLGDLIDRMPAGLMQPVGETAWQLSQGEKSRVHLARALLQGAPLTVLDESFAALDPDNLDRCLAAIDRHAGAVLLIAHP